MLEILAHWIISLIEKSSYLGIFVLMAIESACIPVPSEITMPFAGYLVSIGKMNLVGVALIGALGNLAGSLAAYAVGYWGEEAFVRGWIKKYGKFILVSESEYDRAERWFRKHGEQIVFTSRLLPAVRTFISLPAGIARMNLKKFVIYTSVGSFFWSLFLVWIGVKLGENWRSLGVYFHAFDGIIIVSGLIAAYLYVAHKLHLAPFRQNH